METELLKKATEFATMAHKGQMRWDKSPYIAHPIEVSEIGERRYIYLFRNQYKTAQTDEEIESVKIVCRGHDIEEDTKYTAKQYIDHLLLNGLEERRAAGILEALDRLNKNHYTNYLDFVMGASESLFSRIGKWSDITHNLQNLTKGSMKDKYLLARYILEKIDESN